MKNTLLILLNFISINIFAQIPADLPWPAGNCNETPIILHRGVAPATCGTIEAMNPTERYTFGMISVNGAIPNSGRSETTNMDSMYHHSTWTVAQIGVPFGIAINTRTAETFLTASTNWGAGYFGETSVINHGSLGGADEVEAGGAIYKIDAVTGEASLFANLPQQSSTFTAFDCENGDEVVRTNVGVGLGNIVYDEINNQYFVTNIEDGRIYRLDAAGTIIESFDPFTYDDGVAGISILTELPYGVAIEPNGNRLFFGLIEPTSGSNTGGAASPAIYAIDLNASGGFVGDIDNAFLHSGATYDNYVGTETLQVNIPTGSGSSYTDGTTYHISDLEFDPDGNLLVGVRVSCYETFFGSYNHWGEANRVALDGGTQLYSNIISEYDISATGDAGVDDNYGGIASYAQEDGTVIYVSSSADILEEAGPHGLAIWEANTVNAPLDPLGAFSYGAIDDNDPKGAGGDVDVFTACKVICTPPDLVTIADTLCIDEDVSLAALVNDANNIDGTISYYNTLEDAENLDNAISETITLTADNSFYIRKDAVEGCFDIESVALVVNDVRAPVIEGDQTICINNTPTPFTMSSPAIADGNISYQWQSGTTDCNSDFIDIDGATTETYSPSPLTMTTYFRVITNSTLGSVSCSDTSNCITVTVNSAPMRCVPLTLSKN
ncbi:MAG: hypothetical protein ACPG5B_09745 [Chitinophagales bacterium]